VRCLAKLALTIDRNWPFLPFLPLVFVNFARHLQLGHMAKPTKHSYQP